VIFGVDHIVSGVALNIIALGFAKYLAVRFFAPLPGGGPTQSPPLPQLPSLSVPGLSSGLGTIEQNHWFFVSDVASILRGFCTNLSLLSVLAAVLIAFTGWLLWRTRLGLRLRSVGEAPYAAESLGVNVYWYKYIAVSISGALAGLAGAFLVVGLKFQDGQTGGRGFIGLAAMIFGNWRPGGMAMGAGLFGYTDGVQQYDSSGSAMHAFLILVALALVAVAILQYRQGHPIVAAVAAVIAAICLWWFSSTDELPQQLVKAAPYAITLLVMALASQNLRMPKADGLIYRRGGG